MVVPVDPEITISTGLLISTNPPWPPTAACALTWPLRDMAAVAVRDQLPGIHREARNGHVILNGALIEEGIPGEIEILRAIPHDFRGINFEARHERLGAPAGIKIVEPIAGNDRRAIGHRLGSHGHSRFGSYQKGSRKERVARRQKCIDAGRQPGTRAERDPIPNLQPAVDVTRIGPEVRRQWIGIKRCVGSEIGLVSGDHGEARGRGQDIIGPAGARDEAISIQVTAAAGINQGTGLIGDLHRRKVHRLARHTAGRNIRASRIDPRSAIGIDSIGDQHPPAR